MIVIYAKHEMNAVVMDHLKFTVCNPNIALFN